MWQGKARQKVHLWFQFIFVRNLLSVLRKQPRQVLTELLFMLTMGDSVSIVFLFVAGWILGFKLIVGESVCFIPTFILFGFFRLTDERAGVEVDFIPAGYTSCLQVLDKGVNKPFKQFIQQQSIKWLQSTPARCKTQPCHYY
jgi:hypothetical protein